MFRRHADVDFMQRPSHSTPLDAMIVIDSVGYTVDHKVYMRELSRCAVVCEYMSYNAKYLLSTAPARIWRYAQKQKACCESKVCAESTNTSQECDGYGLICDMCSIAVH